MGGGPPMSQAGGRHSSVVVVDHKQGVEDVDEDDKQPPMMV